MASVTCSSPCGTGATSLAWRQLRYFCCSLAGWRSSRLVKPVGHQSCLPKGSSRLARPDPQSCFDADTPGIDQAGPKCTGKGASRRVPILSFWRYPGVTSWNSMVPSGRARVASCCGLVLTKSANSRSFVVFNVENGIELGDLQQVVHFLGQVQQLQFATLVAHGGKGAD